MQRQECLRDDQRHPSSALEMTELNRRGKNEEAAHLKAATAKARPPRKTADLP